MGTKARDFSRVGGVGGSGSNLTIADILPYLTTANVKELVGNVYYTDSRVFANISLASIDALFDVSTTGNNTPNVGYVLTWDGNVWAPNAITASLDGLTTDDLPEGTSNLYYTDERSRAAISAANPTIIYDPLTGLISANVEAISFSANTTDGLPEGFTNLYFTNIRAFANLQLASIGDLRDVNFTYAAPGPNLALIYNANAGYWEAGEPTSGRAFFADTAEQANVVSTLGNFTTDDLAEGSNNLYFTEARVIAAATANLTLNTLSDVNILGPNLIVGRLLGWTGSFWEPLDGANISGVATSSFAEKANVANIALYAELANVAYTALVTNFAALAEQANTALFATIAETANSVNFAEFSNVANTALIVEFANVAERANIVGFADLAASANFAILADFANVAEIVQTLAGLDTDDLAEGSNNRYYSDGLVYANVSQMSLDVFADVDTSNAVNGAFLYYNGLFWEANGSIGSAVYSDFAETANVANTVVTISNFTSDDLLEGNVNLYYTSDRVNADVVAALVGKDVTLRNLTVSEDLTVNGNVVTFNVGEFITESKVIRLGSGAISPEGIGFQLGTSANISYSAVRDGIVRVSTGFEANGNIIPAVSGIYYLGTRDRQWRGLFVGASTIYLGNLSLSEGPGGRLLIINTETGEPAPVDTSNVNATQYVTTNRTSNIGGVQVEQKNFFVGNVEQYTSGVTGNIYYGIVKNGNIDQFGGMHVQQTIEDSNTSISLIFQTQDETKGSSTPLVLRGDGNTVITGNVTVNEKTLTQISRESISVQNSEVTSYSNTSVAGNVSYNAETGVVTVNKDGVYEATAILTITSDWQNTPINGSYMPTGTYVVQIYANDSTVGGGHNSEYYSGFMSWFAEETDSLQFDEITLHRAGAGPGSGTLFLRVLRTSTSGTDSLILQIAGTTNNSSTSSYTFKFRRLL
jgi:hypothetical protein